MRHSSFLDIISNKSKKAINGMRKFTVRQRDKETHYHAEVCSKKHAHGRCLTESKQQKTGKTREKKQHEETDVHAGLFSVRQSGITQTLDPE